MCSKYGAGPPMARIHKSRNQGINMVVAPLPPISDPLANILLSIPETLYSAGLKISVPKGILLLPGDTAIIPLN